MATSLKLSETEGRIDHLQFNTYYMVQRLWKSVQRILRYFDSERTSLLRHKIGFHGNVAWDIEKKISDLLYTPKTLSYGLKIAKSAPGLALAYDMKLVGVATSL